MAVTLSERQRLRGVIASYKLPLTVERSREICRCCGFSMDTAHVLRDESRVLKALRDSAPIDRIQRKLGPDWQPPKVMLSYATGTGLPCGTPEERLILKRKTRVKALLARFVPACAKWNVILTDFVPPWIKTPGAAGQQTLYLPKRWFKEVEKRDLAFLEEETILVLDVEPLPARSCQLFRATWLRRVKKNTLILEDGFIVRGDRLTYAATTLDEVIIRLMTGLEKVNKLKAALQPVIQNIITRSKKALH